MKKKTGISLSKNDFKIDRKTIKRLLKIGIPVALQDGFIQIAFIIITIIANRRVIAVGHVDRMGKSLCFCHTDITDETGRLLATLRTVMDLTGRPLEL